MIDQRFPNYLPLAELGEQQIVRRAVGWADPAGHLTLSELI
ncbi:hypothetical protein [Micropruina sp.]